MIPFVQKINQQTTLEYWKEILTGNCFSSFGAFAYITDSGAAQVITHLGSLFENTRCSRWVFGFDYGRSHPTAIRKLAQMSQSEIRIYDGDYVVQSQGFTPRVSFHMKTALTRLDNGEPCKRIVGSGNLSASGLMSGVEAGCVIDYATISQENKNTMNSVLDELWNNAVPLDKPYILSVRRLVYSKGIDLLVRAFGEISGRIPHDLILVGDGPERQNLEGLVSGLGLRQRVRFTGSLPFEAVCSYIKGADVHVCPSRSEGGGLVNIIAAAAGCPAIGSDVEGIPEYVMNEETGLLFRAGDIRDLEDKMLDLLLDDGKREKMKETGRVFGEKFATPRIMDQYLALYERARGRVRSSFLPWSPLTDRLYQRIMTR